MYFTTIFKTGEKKEKTTYVQVGTKDIWEIAVLFAQFSYECKTLQKKKYIYIYSVFKKYTRVFSKMSFLLL